MEYSILPVQDTESLHKGGSGVVRRIMFLSDCQISMLSERRLTAPWGLSGGMAGVAGKNTLFHANAIDTGEKLPGKFTRMAVRGDILEVCTPGGGGWGKLSGNS